MGTVTFGLDLDEELLSHLPISDSWVKLSSENFSADLINDSFIRDVFEWQREYVRSNRDPAPIAVLEHQFPELHLEEPQTAIGDLIERLRSRFARNQQRQKLISIMEMEESDPLQVPSALIRAGRDLKHILSKRGETYGTGDIDRVLHEYDRQVLRGPGASLGWKDLNDYFYGMRGLTAVIGAPKVGKSWIIIQQAYDNICQGRCVHLYSLELPSLETEVRLKCLAANVPFGRYIKNRLTKQDMDAMREASEKLDSCGTYKIMKPPAGKRSIDELINRSAEDGADVIFIDQLQYVESDDGVNLGAHNNTGVYWGVLNKARDYSDDIPICYAHQFGRKARECDVMPSMELAKGSSSIEETATLALGLWANKDMRRRHLLEIGVLCARNANYASWRVDIDHAYGCSFNLIGRTDLDDE